MGEVVNERPTKFRPLQCEHGRPENAKHSPVGPHMGADLGTMEIAPGAPIIG